MAPWPEVEKPETNNYIGDSSKQNQNMAGKEGENHKGNVLTLSYKRIDRIWGSLEKMENN